MNLIFAVGTVDTAIQAGLDNAVATWGATQTVLLSIGVFMICYALFKRVRRA